MDVRFVYWGQHELVERLSRVEHRGRHQFWFEQEFFDLSWFEKQIQTSIEAVGPRYTPELNIDLPLAKVFEGIGRTHSYFEPLFNAYRRINKSLEGYVERSLIEFDPSLGQQFVAGLRDLLSHLGALVQTTLDRNLDFDGIQTKLTSLQSDSYSFHASEVTPSDWTRC